MENLKIPDEKNIEGGIKFTPEELAKNDWKKCEKIVKKLIICIHGARVHTLAAADNYLYFINT